MISDDTLPSIKMPRYKFQKTSHPDIVMISTRIGHPQPYTIDTLKKLVAPNMPEAFRQMALGALRVIGYKRSSPADKPDRLKHKGRYIH